MTLRIHGVDQASTFTGIGSVAVEPLVAMDRVQLVLNKKRRVAEILIGFNGAVDATEANSTTPFRLTAPRKGHSLAAKNGKTSRLRSATDEGANDVVAPEPISPFARTRPVQLIIYGTGPSALRDTDGPSIDGTDDGNPMATLSRGGAVVFPGRSREDVIRWRRPACHRPDSDGGDDAPCDLRVITARPAHPGGHPTLGRHSEHRKIREKDGINNAPRSSI